MRLLLAITGASGVEYGKRLLEVLSENNDTSMEIIVSDAGRELLESELELSYSEMVELAGEEYGPDELDAPPSSGSSRYDGMAIVPCSMSSLSKISKGISDNLITRAAAVFLKEERKLVLTPRETPLSTTWLKNMYEISDEGATILPAMPAFYQDPSSIDDMVDFVVGKILDSFEIEHSLYDRWEE